MYCFLDPNVDVVYVSPTPLGEEVIEYYHKLLTMGPAGESSKHHVHFVSPEKLNSFKMHNMALSSLVLYSPVCLSRIKRLIAGREAYIVSGTVTKEDLAIAYELGEFSVAYLCMLIVFCICVRCAIARKRASYLTTLHY